MNNFTKGFKTSLFFYRSNIQYSVLVSERMLGFDVDADEQAGRRMAGGGSEEINQFPPSFSQILEHTVESPSGCLNS